MNPTTTPARDMSPVVEIHPSELRVVGVRLLDSEYVVLRNIAARMKREAPLLSVLIEQQGRAACKTIS